MLFVDRFDRNKKLDDQIRDQITFPLVFDRNAGLRVDYLKGVSRSGYFLTLDDKISQISALQAAYVIAVKKDGYVSGYELWKAFHPPEAGHYIVREELVLVRKAISGLTDRQLIKTKKAADNDSELKTRGIYRGELGNHRRDHDIHWNGFRLNSKTHYFQLPNGRGFDNLTHDQFKIVESLLGEVEVPSYLLAKRTFNYGQNERDWVNFRQLLYQLRKKIGHEFLTRTSNNGYCLFNPTQSHPQKAYASRYQRVPVQSA